VFANPETLKPRELRALGWRVDRASKSTLRLIRVRQLQYLLACWMSMNIERIIADLRSERDRLDRAIGALEGGRRYSAGTPSQRRRRMSAAARRRISAGMKARWAAKKKGARPQQKTASKQKRRGGITAAGRKRLSEMMKQRWAERRKQAKSA